MIEVFKHPRSFVWHSIRSLFVNGVDIFHEVGDAVKSYQAKEWKDFGSHIGAATAKTVLGSYLQGIIEVPDYGMYREVPAVEQVIDLPFPGTDEPDLFLY